MRELFEDVFGNDPLDLTEDTRNGNLYVVEFGAKKLTLARPIRGGVSHQTFQTAVNPPATEAGAQGGALGAVLSDDPRLLRINEILDERIRPALAGDGGWLEVLALNDNTLSIRYQGACGSCPSSISGTLMAIEGMLRQEVDPELEVVAV